MFENLSQRLEGVIKDLTGRGRITEANVAESMRGIRRALLEADVNYQIARTFANSVQEKALGERILRSVEPGQMIVKIVYDELVQLLGGDAAEINLGSNPPAVVLIAGLQGSGKTTFSAKLALHLKSKGRVPMLAAADVYRPAAVDQLNRLGEEADVPVYSITADDGTVVQDAPRVAQEAVAYARKQARDTVIIDTAGRMHVDARMMAEVEEIKRLSQPSEILFVVDSMTGQDAVNTAKEFNNRLNFDGVVLTKLDGDARGGAALSVRSVVNKPIKFASTGEKLDQLLPFFPDRMARRILGMGDVVTLVEKAQEQYDVAQAETLRLKIRKATFDLEDYFQQLQKIRSMGSLSEVAGMIPGMGKQSMNVEAEEREMMTVEAAIQSMTPWERRNPDAIDSSRRRRIAQGSGLTVRDINQLLRQFRQLRKLMKKVQRMVGKKGKKVDVSALLQSAMR